MRYGRGFMSRRITSRHVETLGAQSVAERDDFRPKIIETRAQIGAVFRNRITRRYSPCARHRSKGLLLLRTGDRCTNGRGVAQLRHSLTRHSGAARTCAQMGLYSDFLGMPAQASQRSTGQSREPRRMKKSATPGSAQALTCSSDR